MILQVAATHGPAGLIAGRIMRRPSATAARSGKRNATNDHTEGAEPATAENWDLVDAAQHGDSSAFGLLYDRYVDVVYRYVLFRLGDRDLAEDVTSETFLRALRRITSVSYQGRDVGAWFVTIARNLILDHVKSSRFRLEVVTDEVTEPGAALFSGVGVQAPVGPEQQVISRATRTELLRCVAELGEDQRECIILRFMQGLSVAETAEIMQRNDGAIKALQHRAVRRLAQLLPSGLR
jgi:RNA polymerase sigma-70 factor (ECF subfamily)